MPLTQRALIAIFTIIIIEGYVVLSSELLAIRVTMPFIGSGTDIVSVIIAAVLLPLSFGYYFGGKFRPHRNIFGKWVTVRGRLTTNIVVSAAFLLVGISYLLLSIFMESLMNWGIGHRLALAVLYSLLFLVVPVFLLGQTIPLISHYFGRQRLSRITGKILFFSTIGSFLGACFSTLVLMATIGVHYTAALNFVLLAALFALLARRRHIALWAGMFTIMVIGIAANTGAAMRSINVIANNQYNVVTVLKSSTDDTRILSLNRNSDSYYDPETKKKHDYIDFIENNFIYSRWSDAEPIKVLVIGAGGFTLGLDDPINTYHYVDIDPQLKEIAEKDFLDRPLNENQIFHPVPAESFVIEKGEKFDLIVIDAFQGDTTLPENLVTQDFFARVKNRLKDDGIVVCNFVLNPAFGDDFAKNLDTTMRSVYPLMSRHIVGQYNGWDTQQRQNVMYIYHHRADENERTIYTDNKNTSYYDRPKTRVEK